MRESREFAGEERSVAEARRFVAEVLAEWKVESGDAVLMVSELATNAVIHASSPFTVELSCSPEGVVRVEVHDSDPTAPVPEANLGQYSPRGRGLLLVTTLSPQWGYESRGYGKTVWFEL